DPLPVLGGDLLQRPARVDAGGGDDGVEAAGGAGEPVHGALGAPAVGQVGLHALEVVLRRVPVEDEGAPAVVGDPAGDGGAEPGGAAGDEDVHEAFPFLVDSRRVVERPSRRGSRTTSPSWARTVSASGSVVPA